MLYSCCIQTEFLQKNEIYCKNSLSENSNLDLDIICIYPCSDIGHESIINQLKKISIKYKDFMYTNTFHMRSSLNCSKIQNSLLYSILGIIESILKNTFH